MIQMIMLRAVTAVLVMLQLVLLAVVLPIIAKQTFFHILQIQVIDMYEK
jgi:hypothetical protein